MANAAPTRQRSASSDCGRSGKNTYIYPNTVVIYEENIRNIYHCKSLSVCTNSILVLMNDILHYAYRTRYCTSTCSVLYYCTCIHLYSKELARLGILSRIHCSIGRRCQFSFSENMMGIFFCLLSSLGIYY